MNPRDLLSDQQADAIAKDAIEAERKTNPFFLLAEALAVWQVGTGADKGSGTAWMEIRNDGNPTISIWWRETGAPKPRLYNYVISLQRLMRSADPSLFILEIEAAIAALRSKRVQEDQLSLFGKGQSHG